MTYDPSNDLHDLHADRPEHLQRNDPAYERIQLYIVELQQSRDELLAAAKRIEAEITPEHPDSNGYYSPSIHSSDSAALSAAIAKATGESEQDEPDGAGAEPDLGAVDYRETLERGYPEAGR